MNFKLRENPHSFLLHDECSRHIFVADCDENLDGVDRETIVNTLFEQLEEVGISVRGEHCQHEFDCCGRWYPSAMEVIHIDTSYNIVLVVQDFHRNV